MNSEFSARGKRTQEDKNVKDMEEIDRLFEKQSALVRPIFNGHDGWLRVIEKKGLTAAVSAGLGTDPDANGRPALPDPALSDRKSVV